MSNKLVIGSEIIEESFLKTYTEIENSKGLEFSLGQRVNKEYFEPQTPQVDLPLNSKEINRKLTLFNGPSVQNDIHDIKKEELEDINKILRENIMKQLNVNLFYRSEKSSIILSIS